MGSLILALRQRAPLSILGYIFAQLVSLPPIWLGAWLLGIWSPWYAAIYVLFTLPILAAILWIVHDVLLELHAGIRAIAVAFILAVILARIAFVGLSHAPTGYDWLNLVLGAYLAWAGILVGTASAYIERWDLGLILGCLWLGQSVSCFGWTLHLWANLNWILDPLLGVTAFLLIAWRCRIPTMQYRQR